MNRRWIGIFALCALCMGAAAPAEAQKKKKTVKKKPAVVKTPPAIARLKPFAGTWVLISPTGKELFYNKVLLTNYGTFRSVGSNYVSEGTYDVGAGQILMRFLKSDGKPLKVPGLGKYRLVEGGKAFIIDRFKYGKRPYTPPPPPPPPPPVPVIQSKLMDAFRHGERLLPF